MSQSFEYPRYPFVPLQDLGAEAPANHPVVIIGGGPVGLCAALDLAKHGHRVVILNSADTVSFGSRAICWSKRTLEICDRLGIGRNIVEKGITWKDGRVFFKEDNIYNFNLLPEDGHQYPAFVNLQQYYFELFAIDAAETLGTIDIRWQNKVVGIEDQNDHVIVDVETPGGAYRIAADYVLAADGARSTVRRQMGLDFKGQVFEDRFLIADVKMTAGFPTERWFWFDPPFNPDQSALLHKQSDNIWRIDLQLGWDADPEQEKKPENVLPRIKRMLGEDTPFELEWVSVYTFQCRRLDRFRHNRVIFIGDSAHQVSPFGARGGNGGIQDADNLIWKLDLVMKGMAPQSLLDTYDTERIFAGDENILNSTRSTDFITPKSPASKRFRDAALVLAKRHTFARRIVNSGRLSVPSLLTGSPLNTADIEDFHGGLLPGSPLVDAPIEQAGERSWLLSQFGGGFCLLIFGNPEQIADLTHLDPAIRMVTIEDGDANKTAFKRYDAAYGTAYLVRPDQHVAARWRQPSADLVNRAFGKAIGKE